MTDPQSLDPQSLINPSNEWWFAEIEQRLSEGDVSAKGILAAADQTWKALDKKQIFPVERANIGEWIRRWLQAVVDFEKWRNDRNA